MHGEGFFYQAFIYLTAAVVSVPVAKRLGLGSVLGYLIAGVLIGPYVLGLVGEEGQDVMHFAEFGVVMMLFLVGLELRPALLWRLRGPIVGLGGLQVAVTALVLAALTLALGEPWRVALATGLILALSSTAIVLQTLNEKGLMTTHGGQSSFAVLLFQDIAVIPMLAVLPLLAPPGHAGQGDAHGAGGRVDTLPGWAHLEILARASDRPDAYELLEAGVERVYRDTLDTSLRMGVDALRLLGIRGYQAHRAARTFRRRDEESVRELASMRHDERRYIDAARERIRELEELLLADHRGRDENRDVGWDAESLRREYGKRR